MRSLFIFLFLFSFNAVAGRPLITDDAGVIGNGNFQIETWAFSDKRSHQLWIVPTMGFGHSVEVSAAFVQGTLLTGDDNKTYASSGPIMQSKIAISSDVALAGGFIPPFGSGQFRSVSWDYFFYVALTRMFFEEKIKFHVNLGGQTLRQNKHSSAFLWGVAVEYMTSRKSHLFVESANGEVYAFIPGIAFQGGFRYDVTETLQVDGTIGRGVTGDPLLPFWGTIGIKKLF